MKIGRFTIGFEKPEDKEPKFKTIEEIDRDIETSYNVLRVKRAIRMLRRDHPED